MSNHVVKAYKDGNGSSGTSSHSHPSCWMSRWTQAPSKQGSLVAPHSQAIAREEGLDHKQKRLRGSLNISPDISRCYGVIRNNTKAETVELAIGNLTIRAQNVGKERSDYGPFCFLGHSRNGENSWTRTPMDSSCCHVPDSPSATKNCGNFPMFDVSSGRKDLAGSESSEDDADNPGKITVFKRHFSDNEYASVDQGMSKCGKYSAIVVHERSSFRPLRSTNHSEDMQNDPKSEFYARLADAQRPCCGRPPLFSQTSTRHVLFTSQTGVARRTTQHRGVKIQPLWSSTDSERDNLGDAETPRGERSLDSSTETDTMDAVALPNKSDFSGMLLSPLAKSTTREKSPWEDKVRGKLPVSEPTETNSMDYVEPSPSRTQSLEAEHLLSCAEKPFESKSMPQIDECGLQEPSSRWVKRLKLSSTKIGESSSNEKTHTFFNVFTKCSSTSPEAPSMEKHQSKESSMPTQNMVPVMNGEPSLRNKNPIFECSWIQRWCQDRAMPPNRLPSEGVVICEPHTSKLQFEELDKKRFPSIAAVALMGKSMDGFPPCKITKRGSLVVWNTEDY